MANISGYTFENMSRIGNDSCALDQESVQNVNACNYLLQNFFINDCKMNNPISLATSQPGVFYNGPSNVGSGGCVVDENSKLSIGSLQTHPKCRLELFQRPFATVPFLGRGSASTVLESQIQQGEQGTNKRSVTNLGERSYINYHNTPLQPDIKNRVTNPAYCVESAASEGWIRGGLPSRDLSRDKEFYN